MSNWYNRIYQHGVTVDNHDDAERALAAMKCAAAVSQCVVIDSDVIDNYAYAMVFVPNNGDFVEYRVQYDRFAYHGQAPGIKRSVFDRPKAYREDSGYVTFVVMRKGSGNLLIYVNQGHKKEVKEIAQQERSTANKFADIIEYQLGNGWEWISPERIGALTEAPILSDDVSYSDDDDQEDIGRVFWFPNYMIIDEVEELATKGYVIFTGEYGEDDDATRS